MCSSNLYWLILLEESSLCHRGSGSSVQVISTGLYCLKSQAFAIVTLEVKVEVWFSKIEVLEEMVRYAFMPYVHSTGSATVTVAGTGVWGGHTPVSILSYSVL
ncbi:hypothetical protein AVEN_93141-1 [Araneus ventricosus]|uniref:Uncharacterized protein n=1 Tax=Araneus ventricosus TaxID=182803 RepID=A0A4Y2IH24_ARAVE|nr:hypothetical protein AVEN_93141-1 [Araneus ventricosus]